MTAIIGRRATGAQLYVRALCGLILAFGSLARADQLDVAKRLYHELDYDSARVALLRAAQLRDPHRRAEAYVYLGLIDTVEGDDDAARQSFRQGLVLDPGLELPLGTSPKVARIFNRVKAEIVSNAQRVSPPPQPAEPVPPQLEASPPPTENAPPRVQSAPLRAVEVNPAPASEATAAAPAPSHGGRWAAGAMFIAGLAAAATGIYFGAQEQALESSFHQQPKTAYQSDVNKLYVTPANQAALVADILYSSGAVVGLTGLGLWFAF